MKLLIENWRKFIKEDIGYFGNKFVDFMKEVDKGTHPLLAAQLHLDYIDKGSTRKVFGFPDNDSHLLKVINVDLSAGKEVFDADWKNPFTGFSRKHKTVSNENEADLMMQQRYPQIFPRTYEVADDYSWILAERVEPISPERLAEELGIPKDLTHYNNKQTYIKLIEIILMTLRGDFGDLNEEVDDTLEMGDLSPSQTPPEQEEEEGYSLNTLYEMAKEILKNPHLKKLFKAVLELKIPPREMTAKNLGISKFGGEHLVILDASLWEYEEAAAPKPPPKKVAPPRPVEDTYVMENKVLKIKFLRQ